MFLQLAVHAPEGHENWAAMCIHGTHSTLVDAEAHVKRLAKEQADIRAYIIDQCGYWISVAGTRARAVCTVPWEKPCKGTGNCCLLSQANAQQEAIEEEEIQASENDDQLFSHDTLGNRTTNLGVAALIG